MKCKLCQEEKKLVKSHIIPEFFYKELYDSKNRYLYIHVDLEKKIKLYQKGQWEKLLCVDCENKFSKLEAYVYKLLFGGKISIKLKCSDKTYFQIEKIDYKIFKLFQLSILWRSSVTSLPFFSHVNLGPHQELIRLMLINNNPGRYYDFGCMMASITLNKNLLDVLRRPDKICLEGKSCYTFIFGGFMWQFIDSINSKSFSGKSEFLQENGEQIILKLDYSELDFLRDEIELFKLRKNDEKFLKNLAKYQ